MECLNGCKLNIKKITMKMLADREIHDTTIKILDTKKKGINYRLEYSPVGNQIQEPTIIICGITPGNDTWQMFLDSIRAGESFEKATSKSIYSNMRKNMFMCLEEIGLFDYLADINEYWHETQNTKSKKKDYWNKIFSDETASRICGIQLTQACNCAILRNTDSKQPSKTAINEIRKVEPRCLFNRFKINSCLKLIIFLGTTLNLEQYWKDSCYFNPDIKVLSIPHPSGSSRVYNNGDLFKPIDEKDNTALRNAKNRITEAKQIIDMLRSKSL